MKKIITFSAALILGVCAFGATHNIRAAKADTLDDDQVTALKNLLTSYNDGGYTKKTQMYLTDKAITEMAEYFHAGANTLKRATYYNSTETALLMGNYDGTFSGVGGSSGINSGYRNKDEGVEHFHYEDTAATEANLFAEGKTVADWTAAGQTVGGYYQTLTSLSNSIVGTDWVESDGAYIHDIKNLHVTDGEYDDPVLKKFQYFAAPMMLQNAYFSWHTIRVVEGASFLSIRLYTTAADGEQKSTLVGGSEALVSEARIYKGIHLNPEVTWTLKGSFDSWGAGVELEYQADLYVPEQYKITKELTADSLFKITDGTNWYGYDQLEAGCKGWLNRWNSGESDNSAMPKVDGKYTIYWKPKAPSAWVSIVTEYTFTGLPSWVISSDCKIFAHVWGGTYGDGTDIVAEGAILNSSTIKFTFHGDVTNIILLRCVNTTITPNWDLKSGDDAGRIYNKTGTINLSAGTVSYEASSWVEHK